MGKSQETWNKKENEKKKQKKKKEKEARKEERKANSKGNSFEIAYVDEFGNFSSTPPDPTTKVKVNEADIQISVPRHAAPTQADLIRKGIVTFFNDSKGYGFITHEDGRDVFVHYSTIAGDGFKTLVQGQEVRYEAEDGPKGLHASLVMKAAESAAVRTITRLEPIQLLDDVSSELDAEAGLYHIGQTPTLWRELRDVSPFVDVFDHAVWKISVAPTAGAGVVAVRAVRPLDRRRHLVSCKARVSATPGPASCARALSLCADLGGPCQRACGKPRPRLPRAASGLRRTDRRSPVSRSRHAGQRDPSLGDGGRQRGLLRR